MYNYYCLLVTISFLLQWCIEGQCKFDEMAPTKDRKYSPQSQRSVADSTFKLLQPLVWYNIGAIIGLYKMYKHNIKNNMNTET